MGTTAIHRSEFSALEFNIKIQIHDLNLVRSGLSGDTIMFQSIRDVEGAQSKLNLYDEDIGIAFTSAYFTEKPLSIKKLSALISAKGNINTDFSGYCSAFRDLMSDFSSSHVPTFTLTVNPARIQDIFFSEFDSAVLINYKKIALISRTERNTYCKLLFDQNHTIRFSTKENVETILTDFMSDDGELSVDEYFLLNRKAL